MEDSQELDNSDFYRIGSSLSMGVENDSLHSDDGDGDGGVSPVLELVYGPTLQEATANLKWAFWLHTYGFGCLFFFLAFYSFFSILNLR